MHEKNLLDFIKKLLTKTNVTVYYSPPLQKGAAAIGGGGIFLHRGEANEMDSPSL